MEFKIKVTKTENKFIATCPELDANCFASTREDVIRRIKEVIKFYISSAREMGFDIDSDDCLTIAGENLEIETGDKSFLENIPQIIN
ncbi:MAG: hypothetical protein JW982_03825 [Spirochaetes bacterium]|nr:hypothetical protein [Spirochaetota bacterium]